MNPGMVMVPFHISKVRSATAVSDTLPFVHRILYRFRWLRYSGATFTVDSTG